MILIFTLLSIVAAVFVSKGKALTANCIWAISNVGIIYHNLHLGEYEMALLFVAYEIIALYGIYNLKLKANR